MPELRKLRGSTQMQSDIITARATQALTSPISTEIDECSQQTVGLDTFQLSPSLVDPTNRVAPQPDGAPDDRQADFRSRVPHVLEEPEHHVQRSDHSAGIRSRPTGLDWLISRNEDQQTYAVDFRVRHAF